VRPEAGERAPPSETGLHAVVPIGMGELEVEVEPGEADPR
jgi:hypothetical protein